METTMIVALIAGLLIGLIAGAAAAWLIAASRLRAQQAEESARNVAELEQARSASESSRANVAEALQEVAEARTEAAQARESAAQAREQLAGEQAARTAAERAAELARERAEDLAKDRQQLADQFDALSKRTLEAQSKQVDASAQQRFQETKRLVEPVAEALQLFNERLIEVEKTRVQMSAELRTHVTQVQQTNEQLRLETSKLSNALRRPEVRGRWGEKQLRNVVESAGMLSRCDFDEQVQATSGGNALRPDMVINLAEGKRLYVDAKTPLDAFSQAVGADDATVRDAHLEQFCRHVRKHIDDLGRKKYWDVDDANSPEFVVLFFPGENFFQAALELDANLYEYAMARNVVLTGPFNLIALLRTVDLAWRQQAIVDNAREVAELGKEMYARLKTSGTHVKTLGTALGRAVEAYNKTLGSFEKNVFTQARRFEDLELVKPDLPDMVEVTNDLRQLSPTKWVVEEDTLPLGRPTPDVDDLLALEEQTASRRDGDIQAS